MTGGPARRGFRSAALALLLAAVGGLAIPDRALAQLPAGGASNFQMPTGVGYSIVLPDALLGLGAFHVFGGGPWGVYADGHLTHGSRTGDPEYLENETVASIEARLPALRREEVDEVEEWLIFNAGIVRAITPHMAITIGGGLARRSVIREYIDRTPDAETPSGFFLVEDERLSGWEANALVNALIRAGSRVGWMVGFELAPRSFALGLFATFQ